MLLIEPNATQHRAAAVGLVIIAALTAALVAAEWLDTSKWPPLLPLAIAYFLFNFGYLVSTIRSRLQTRGARIGFGAVTLNMLAMVLSDFAAIWTALSLCAVAAALVGAVLLFKEARGAAA